MPRHGVGRNPSGEDARCPSTPGANAAGPRGSAPATPPRADALVGARPGPIDPRADWDVLEPVRHLGPEGRAGLPALDIVSVCRSGRPGLVRDHGHAFVRLIDAEGGVRPVGFFPDESTGIEPDRLPGLRMPGMLLLPDKYDRIAWNPLVTRITLSEDEFRGLVAHVEDMQRGRRRGTLAFDIVDRSCVGFVVRVAALAGVAVAADARLSDFLDVPGRPGLTRMLRRAMRAVPAGPRRVAVNLVLACRGGLRTHSRQWIAAGTADGPTLELVGDIRPLFSGWRDLARRDVPFHHVHALRVWQDDVAAGGLQLHRAGST